MWILCNSQWGATVSFGMRMVVFYNGSCRGVIYRLNGMRPKGRGDYYISFDLCLVLSYDFISSASSD